MTEMEALEVARVVSMADGGCSHCIHTLTEELKKSFPDFDWAALAAKFWDGHPNDC